VLIASTKCLVKLYQSCQNAWVIKLCVIVILTLWPSGWVVPVYGEALPATPDSVRIEIRSVAVQGHSLAWGAGDEVHLPSFPEKISIYYGAARNSSRPPLRLRYRLEGYDQAWREGPGEMYLAVRFLDEAGEQMTIKRWNLSGESPGWNGDLVSATFTHRREMVVVPPGTTHIQMVITSAGPPATVGLYVVDDLVVSKFSSSAGPATVLLGTPFGQPGSEAPVGQNPPGWIRQGTNPRMAKVVEIGRPTTRALAILDEDPRGHAEWHSLKTRVPHVSPSDQLLMEWNEVYTMGLAGDSVAVYEKLSQGRFRFCVVEVTALGLPTEVQASLSLLVPPPLWGRPWFWASGAALVIAAAVATGRYVSWRRMRDTMLRLQQERVVEQERLRIAQNIHDDLGARVTQLSLLSGVSQNDPQFPEKAREAFGTISRMSRELVSALYETVWAVDPEKDNLESLGSYLCQMVAHLGHEAQLRCRLPLLDLPSDVQVSSHTRHHVALAVKEAVHNVIKHAQASELTLGVAWNGHRLTVALQDNGRGFSMKAETVGHGLTNMKRRLAELGGTCSIQSEVGRGTTVQMCLEVGGPKAERPAPIPVQSNNADGAVGSQR